MVSKAARVLGDCESEKCLDVIVSQKKLDSSVSEWMEAESVTRVKWMTGKLFKLCSKIVVTMDYNVLESLNNLSFVLKHGQTSMHNPASLIL